MSFHLKSTDSKEEAYWRSILLGKLDNIPQALCFLCIHRTCWTVPRSGCTELIYPCIGYLVRPFEKKAVWAYIANLFLAVMGDSAIEIAGESFSFTRENTGVGQQTIRERIRWLSERPAKDLSESHVAMSWMDQVHRLDARTPGPASSCPVVVVVQPTHDWKSDHLLACVMREKR
jgi:hypothetical protein